ncbi:hypothetical protein SAMN04488574_10634 [Bacillus sp. 71mf]|nr:hypothetical protein SAMN04488574_10634 [Bacillus sp. 71mf]SFS68226.1 hypothetical protein SAMN04488145_102424 [Bacillus sp. 103mf]
MKGKKSNDYRFIRGRCVDDGRPCRGKNQLLVQMQEDSFQTGELIVSSNIHWKL